MKIVIDDYLAHAALFLYRKMARLAALDIVPVSLPCAPYLYHAQPLYGHQPIRNRLVATFIHKFYYDVRNR